MALSDSQWNPRNLYLNNFVKILFFSGVNVFLVCFPAVEMRKSSCRIYNWKKNSFQNYKHCYKIQTIRKGFPGTCCEMNTAIVAWSITWKYAYCPFKLNPTSDCILALLCCSDLYFSLISSISFSYSIRTLVLSASSSSSFGTEVFSS